MRRTLLERAMALNAGIVWLVLGLFGALCSISAGYVLYIVFDLVRGALA